MRAAQQEAQQRAWAEAIARARDAQATDACTLRFPDGAAPAQWDACMRLEVTRIQNEEVDRQLREGQLAVEAKRLEFEAASLDEQRSENQRRQWARAAAALNQMNQPRPAPATVYVAPPLPRPVNCTTNRIGDTAYTNCN